MATKYWVGGDGVWSSLTNWRTTSGGAIITTPPGSADAARLDSNSGASVVTVDSNITVQTLTCSTFTGTLAFGTNTISLNSTGTIFTGSLTMTVTGTPLIIATNNSATARTINAQAVSEANSISFRITAGTGTLAFSSNGAVRDLDFTDGVNPTGYGGEQTGNTSFTIYGSFTASTNMTKAAGTGVMTFAATSGIKTITTAGVIFDNPFIFNGIGGTFAFQDALTQGSTRAFTITNGTVQLKNGVTSTVGAFATSGTNQKFLQSTLAGTQATLSQASGTVNASYLTIKDINTTGGATFNAYVTNNNVNSGNNTGWDFYLPANSIYDSLRLRGYTGTVTDMLLQYYKANGATSNSLQDAESEFLILKGFTLGSNTDKWYAYLRSLSFTGTVTDMLFNYWKDPA